MGGLILRGGLILGWVILFFQICRLLLGISMHKKYPLICLSLSVIDSPVA